MSDWYTHPEGWRAIEAEKLAEVKRADEVERLRADNDILRSHYHDHRAEVERLREKVNLSARADLVAQERIAELEAEVERLHAEYGRQIANLEKHIDANDAEVERLNEKVNLSARADLAAQERIAELEAKIERLTAEISAGEISTCSVIGGLEADIERLKAALKEIAGLSHNCRGTDIARAALANAIKSPDSA